MELKKKMKDNENPDEERLSYMDEELQFILENFEFNPEFADDVSTLSLNSFSSSMTTSTIGRCSLC